MVGERCHPGLGGLTGAGGGCGGSAARTAVVGTRVERCEPHALEAPAARCVVACTAPQPSPSVAAGHGVVGGTVSPGGSEGADGGPGAGAVARQRGHAVVGSRVRGAIPSCTGSPSGTLVIVLDLLLP